MKKKFWIFYLHTVFKLPGESELEKVVFLVQIDFFSSWNRKSSSDNLCFSISKILVELEKVLF
jgi:hypothetical protein